MKNVHTYVARSEGLVDIISGDLGRLHGLQLVFNVRHDDDRDLV